MEFYGTFCEIFYEGQSEIGKSSQLQTVCGPFQEEKSNDLFRDFLSKDDCSAKKNNIAGE